MIVQCKSCMNRVLPQANGRCPSCGNKVDCADETNRNLMVVLVSEEQEMPDVCIVCGRSTSDRIDICYKIDAEGAAEQRAYAMSHGGLFGFLMYKLFGIGKKTVAFSLPVCDPCSKSQEVKVKGVDLDNHSMTLLAHKNLHKELFPGGVDGWHE